MSIFSKIKDAVFGSAVAQEASPAASTTATPAQKATAAPAAAGATTAPTSQAAATSSAPSVSPMSQVDVEAVLTGLAAKKGQKLDWRKSIVDLMKLLDLDSSLAARKELAQELNYTGDTSDSASMNVWLHKQVMTKLAASGGKVPDDLKA